ncbi:hypothetical protein DPQ33_13085 [Oceanidesulfovibrio indonesiensis]|uniref:Uncharacterized protein n=1 Tax=Oceanidesulfovibrio indonesiensis TaxID=54767 RepID=A0A7M3MCP6_9BACT|nr:hypothetical protein [Oceanidesulfovibrio indonesiensis]TVM16249.1 hypothetical protein DPQ33_13085 [Oceanidesulfovibrio indonesiensis]
MTAPNAPDLVASTLARLPGLTAALAECGDETLAEYSRGFFPPAAAPPIDPLEDFLDAACERAEPLLGADVARALREQLERSPSVLTANHHGLDTLHQSVHSTIAFALPALLVRSDGPRVLPVLACAGVPLGSVTYPRGMVLARKPDLANNANPAKVRIPFFPHALRTCTAGAAPALTAEYFQKALKLCKSMMHEGLLTPSQNAFVCDFITKECMTPDVLLLPGFAEQAVVLNARLWPRLFAQDVRENAPALAYLDMERIVSKILERDLRRNSLVAALLFDPETRSRLLEALDGVAGCWTRKRQERLRGLTEESAFSHDDLRGAGTCFFWMLDATGRQLPMWLEHAPSGPKLTGRTMAGESCCVDFAPGPILQALADHRISPSLFTSYATLAMARGVRCWGGVYQAAYLREMQRGVTHALGGGMNALMIRAARTDAEVDAVPGQHPETREPGETASGRRRAGPAKSPLASRVAETPCGCFLAGLITVFTTFPGPEPLHERMAPSCAADIAAAGGLTREQLEHMAGLTLTQAATAGLLQSYEEITPTPERTDGWYGEMCGYVAETMK